MDNVAGGEQLIKQVYEAIRNSPLWETSLLIVTWDEHGGFYDHVPPGKILAPGDTKPGSAYNKYGFTFRQLGVRVPAVVVSPWILRGTIDHRPYDHSSIPKTVEAAFALQALTQRDQAANSAGALLTLPAARKDTPETLPAPAPTGLLAPPAPQSGEQTVDSGNLPLFLHVAMRHELAISHTGQKQAILRRVQAIKTRAQAAQYLGEINGRLG